MKTTETETETETLPTLLELVDVSKPVKALTISQPFARLIADGRKWVENRSWPTHYTGQLLIHAGKGTQYLTVSQLADYETGVVVAVAELSACLDWHFIQRQHQNDESLPGLNGRTLQDVAHHQHTEGPWCWILSNVRRCQPYSLPGRQGIWQLTDDELAALLG